ncbi:unnamed protein product [Meloidogyne enterolobii]|uniref:Uncharacterized protein n=1 Tax=Meloidogyne enterolobii TaxID=390850 RepID=A0ACB0Y8W2_MELEN
MGEMREKSKADDVKENRNVWGCLGAVLNNRIGKVSDNFKKIFKFGLTVDAVLTLSSIDTQTSHNLYLRRVYISQSAASLFNRSLDVGSHWVGSAQAIPSI